MKESAHRPVLIVIAGPNGSGKTTITSQILHQRADGMTAYDWKKDTATSLGTQTIMAQTTIAASS